MFLFIPLKIVLNFTERQRRKSTLLKWPISYSQNWSSFSIIQIISLLKEFSTRCHPQEPFIFALKLIIRRQIITMFYTIPMRITWSIKIWKYSDKCNYLNKFAKFSYKRFTHGHLLLNMSKTIYAYFHRKFLRSL